MIIVLIIAIVIGMNVVLAAASRADDGENPRQ